MLAALVLQSPPLYRRALPPVDWASPVLQLALPRVDGASPVLQLALAAYGRVDCADGVDSGTWVAALAAQASRSVSLFLHALLHLDCSLLHLDCSLLRLDCALITSLHRNGFPW